MKRVMQLAMKELDADCSTEEATKNTTKSHSRQNVEPSRVCERAHSLCENYVLRLVRVVRNNLFHGGKYQSGPFAFEGVL